MADVHDGSILCVWALVKTQVSLQGILQLNIREGMGTPNTKKEEK